MGSWAAGPRSDCSYFHSRFNLRVDSSNLVRPRMKQPRHEQVYPEGPTRVQILSQGPKGQKSMVVGTEFHDGTLSGPSGNCGNSILCAAISPRRFQPSSWNASGPPDRTCVQAGAMKDTKKNRISLNGYEQEHTEFNYPNIGVSGPNENVQLPKN